MTFTAAAKKLFTAALFFAVFLPFQAAGEELLHKTPRDYEGPFYPVVRQQDEDNNLIQVAGREQKARGDILHLSGRVVDATNSPVADAVVEIWQTDPNGRYNDRRDRSPGKRDPDFQYWGLAPTGPDGSFSFTTLVPGAYEPRPAHIHFKVWVQRKLRLTSQIYFKDNGKLLGDSSARASEYELQTVELKKTGDNEYEAFFRIVI